MGVVTLSIFRVARCSRGSAALRGRRGGRAPRANGIRVIRNSGMWILVWLNAQVVWLSESSELSSPARYIAIDSLLLCTADYGGDPSSIKYAEIVKPTAPKLNFEKHTTDNSVLFRIQAAPKTVTPGGI